MKITAKSIRTKGEVNLKAEGGVLSRPLKIESAPTEPQHVANKLYVDNQFASKQDLELFNSAVADKVLYSDAVMLGVDGKITENQLPYDIRVPRGNIIISKNPITRPGYLRANGAYLSKSMYSGLYALIGDQFDSFGSEITIDYDKYTLLGEGAPWEQQYDLVRDPNAVLGTPYVYPVTLPSNVKEGYSVITKNKLYVLASTFDTNIYMSEIDDNGDLLGFSVVGQLLYPVRMAMVITIKDKVYVMGNYGGGPGVPTHTLDIQYATIQPDGTLSAFSMYPVKLAVKMNQTNFVLTKDRLFLYYGYQAGGGPNTLVQSTAIDSNGDLSGFSIDPLNQAYTTNTGAQCIARNKYTATGGFGSMQGGVYEGSITDGSISRQNIYRGAFHSGTKYFYQRGFVTRKDFYIFSNMAYYSPYPATTLNKRCPIQADGSLVNGGFTTFASSPYAIGQATSLCAVKDRVYMIGGVTGSWGNGATNKIIAFDAPGVGYNDYMPILEYAGNQIGNNIPAGTSIRLGSSNPDPANLFKLPDLSLFEQTKNVYAYIRY